MVDSGLAGLLLILYLVVGVACHQEGAKTESFKVFHVEWERVEVPYVIGLWILVTTLVKLGFHKAPGIKNYMPESSILIIIGLCIGFGFFFLSDEMPTTLTPDIFFLFLLPPIIGEAGYFMPNRLFFDQLGTILLMAVVGTIFNMITIGGSLYLIGLTGLFRTEASENCPDPELTGFFNPYNSTIMGLVKPESVLPGCTDPGLLETFLFGSLIAAVDPVAVLAVFDEIKVDEVLNIVVFGESLLNDGVAVVLYHMFEAYCEIGVDNVTASDLGLGLASFAVVAGGGTLIGIFVGYLCAFTTRFMEHARVLEPLIVLMFAYLSYLTAEIFHMSGILSITFCGITMKNYVEQNISEASSTTIRASAHMFANIAELTIFLFLGVFTVTGKDEFGEAIHDWNWWFVICTIAACIICRVIGVILLTLIANRFRIKKLNWTEQFIMMYGGLRGGVAFALVLLISEEIAPHAKMFVTTTLAMVYWTVFVQGITIKPMVLYFKVKKRSESEPCLTERITNRLMDNTKSGLEDILGDNSEVPMKFRNWYKSFDEKFLKPLLLRDNKYKDPKVMETFKSIQKEDAIQYIQKQSMVESVEKVKTLNAVIAGFKKTSKIAQSVIVEDETKDSSSKTGYDNKAYYPAPDEVIDASDLSMMTLKGQIPVKAEDSDDNKEVHLDEGDKDKVQ